MQPQAEKLHTGKLVLTALELTVLRSAKSQVGLWEVTVPKETTETGSRHEEGNR